MTEAEFPELVELERLIDECAQFLQVRVIHRVTVGTGELPRRYASGFPVYVIALGNASPEVPTVGFFGGVHGLERIGAEVVIAYLRNLTMRLQWDELLHRQLESVRLVFMPLVNPGGVWLGTRANPNGVDLMRNAPIEARERVPFLAGGQRLSARLPWFRGQAGAAMEAEAAALCEVASNELLSRRFSIALDCHSGFGVRDRIWFPYAHTVLPIEHLPEMHALKEVYDRTHPHHHYLFEPQSRQYRAHGDLWDYLYQLSLATPERIFLPLTLEMGSWLWVKKNPRQIFSRHGMFNPLIEHRLQRVLRRHLAWLDFLTRAAASHERWRPLDRLRDNHRERALSLWYRSRPAP